MVLLIHRSNNEFTYSKNTAVSKITGIVLKLRLVCSWVHNILGVFAYPPETVYSFRGDIKNPQKAGDILSASRASEIISRWTDPPAKFAIYKQIFHAEPGWIYLTRRGLREAELDFRAEAPSSRTLEHLYWINEVRLVLEDEYETDEMEWTSERTIQAEQDLRQCGQKLKHIPDGILTLKTTEKTETIDIEVQVSKPSPGEVEEVMGDYWHSGSFNPLRYYVGKRSRGVVRTVHRRMEKELRAMRPRIEIIDLSELHAGEEFEEEDV